MSWVGGCGQAARGAEEKNWNFGEKRDVPLGLFAQVLGLMVDPPVSDLGHGGPRFAQALASQASVDGLSRIWLAVVDGTPARNSVEVAGAVCSTERLQGGSRRRETGASSQPVLDSGAVMSILVSGLGRGEEGGVSSMHGPRTTTLMSCRIVSSQLSYRAWKSQARSDPVQPGGEERRGAARSGCSPILFTIRSALP